MNTVDYKNFLNNCKKQIKPNKNLDFKNNFTNYITRDVFNNVDKVRQIAFNIRYKFINSIDDNLIAFDKNFSNNGGVVKWCLDYNDFLDKLDNLLQKKKVKKLNLFNSFFTEELGIQNYLNDNNYKLDIESSDCIIFSPQFGIINQGCLFFNFNSAYDMELVLNSKIKIFILPITDFIFKMEEIEIFSHLYSIYKDNINFPYLTSFYTPSPTDKNSDVYLFLIDNGRSNVLQNNEIRKILTCINCNACKTVCPIYHVIGDKPYDNVFSGPVANVILPFIENIDSYKHLCFSCVSCGNCSAICPIKIPVSELIIANRKYFFENHFMDIKDVRIAKKMYKTFDNRKNMNTKHWIKKMKLKLLLSNKLSDDYLFHKSTFNQQYINNKYEK